MQLEPALPSQLVMACFIFLRNRNQGEQKGEGGEGLSRIPTLTCIGARASTEGAITCLLSFTSNMQNHKTFLPTCLAVGVGLHSHHPSQTPVNHLSQLGHDGTYYCRRLLFWGEGTGAAGSTAHRGLNRRCFSPCLSRCVFSWLFLGHRSLGPAFVLRYR